MGSIVLGLSTVVSFINAIFLISAPAETYFFGTIWMLLYVPFIGSAIFNYKFIVPTIRRSNCLTGYEVSLMMEKYFTLSVNVHVHVRLHVFHL